LLAAGATIQVQETGGHHPLQTFSTSCGSFRLSMKTCMGTDGLVEILPSLKAEKKKESLKLNVHILLEL